MRFLINKIFLFVIFIFLSTAINADTLSDYSRARKLLKNNQRMESYFIFSEISQVPSEVQDFSLYYFGQLSSWEESIPIYEKLLSLYPGFILATGLRNEIMDYYFKKDDLTRFTSEEIWSLAKIYNSRSRWADSKKALQHWFQNYRTQDKLVEATYLSAINATKLGEFEDAYSYFADVINSNDNKFINLARFQKAKLINAQKGIDDGIEAFVYLRNNHESNSTLMEMVLPELARLYRVKDMHKEAEECYVKYLKMFPKSSIADDIRFQLGRILFVSSNYQSAEKYFSDIANNDNPDQSFAPASLFILSLMPDANPIRKKEIYKRLYNEFPWTYYGHLAAQYLGKRFHREPVEFKRAIDIKSISPKAQLYISLGDYDTAAIYLRPKFYANTNNLQLALYLIELYEKLGDTYNALGISDRVWANFQYRGNLSSMPIVFWEKSNPLYYWEEVREEANKYSVDPYMLLALMRQESRFNYAARSKSNARGLMQLLESTAKVVAKGFGMSNYDLDNPTTNIKFGVKYFADMTKRHPNTTEYVLSCYNAGPNRTAIWVSENCQLEIEEFVEKIPYTETRNYVKVIMKTFWNYRDFYENDPYVDSKYVKR